MKTDPAPCYLCGSRCVDPRPYAPCYECGQPGSADCIQRQKAWRTFSNDAFRAARERDVAMLSDREIEAPIFAGPDEYVRHFKRTIGELRVEQVKLLDRIDLLIEAVEVARRWASDDHDGGAITQDIKAARRELLAKAINGTWEPRR